MSRRVEGWLIVMSAIWVFPFILSVLDKQDWQIYSIVFTFMFVIGFGLNKAMSGGDEE